MADVLSPRQFRLEEDDESPPAANPPATDPIAVNVLMLALKTLGQKTVVAFSKLFTLLTVGSVFWLWMSVPDPNANQLIGFAMYASFVLVVNWLALRRPS